MKTLFCLIFIISGASTLAQNPRDSERLAYCDSLEKASIVQNRPDLASESYYIRGKIASENFDINTSNAWFARALKIEDSLKNNRKMGKIYAYMANNAVMVHNKKDFRYFISKAENSYLLAKDESGLRYIRAQKIGSLISEFSNKQDYKKAITKYQELIPPNSPKTYNDSMHLAAMHFKISWLKLRLGDSSCFRDINIVNKIYSDLKSPQIIAILLTECDALIKFQKFKILKVKISKILKLTDGTDLDKDTQILYFQTMASYNLVVKNEKESLKNSLEAEKLISSMNKSSKGYFSEIYTNNEIINTQKKNLDLVNLTLILIVLCLVVISIVSIGLYKSYKIKSELAFKNSLLVEEVNHRVKNNFQTVANLLFLQDLELKDPSAKQAIEDSQARINTLATVHSHLYGNDKLETVQMDEFLIELCHNLLATFGYKEIVPKYDIDKEPLQSEKAIIVGLIANEWLTNICKYGFKNNSNPKLEISMKYILGEWTLGINNFEDKKINIKKTSNFGMNLIDQLIEQIKGNKKFNEIGNLVAIKFK